MSSPPNPNLPSSVSGAGGPSASHPPDTEPRKIEGIKQYYQQLCTTYRQVSQELQQSEASPERRAALSAQLEKLQTAIQDFTERFIKPIINAGVRVSPRPSGTATPLGVGPLRGAKSTPTQLQPNQAASMPNGMASANVPMPSGNKTKLDLGSGMAAVVTLPVAKGAIEIRHPNMSEATMKLLRETYPQEGILLESTASVRSRQVATEGIPGKALLPCLLRSLSPQVRLSPAAEETLLALADDYVQGVCEGICESARHRGRPGISTKDIEMVMGRGMGMAPSVAGLPFSVPVTPGVTKAPTGKKSSTGNPHLTRLQQLKKHMASQPP